MSALALDIRFVADLLALECDNYMEVVLVALEDDFHSLQIQIAIARAVPAEADAAIDTRKTATMMATD